MASSAHVFIICFFFLKAADPGKNAWSMIKTLNLQTAFRNWALGLEHMIQIPEIEFHVILVL